MTSSTVEPLIYKLHPLSMVAFCKQYACVHWAYCPHKTMFCITTSFVTHWRTDEWSARDTPLGIGLGPWGIGS